MNGDRLSEEHQGWKRFLGEHAFPIIDSSLREQHPQMDFPNLGIETGSLHERAFPWEGLFMGEGEDEKI